MPSAPRRTADAVEIVAHRGASHDAPENTLAAFELAFRQGADAIEGDFRLTADGTVVCIHDPSTRRTAGVDLSVARSAFRRLRRLDVGAWKGARWAGQPVPSIEEVFSVVPDRRKVYVEIKCGPAIFPRLVPAIRSSGLGPDRVVLISFSTTVIAQAKRRLPDYRALWIIRHGAPRESRRPRPSRTDILRTLRATGADGLDSEAHPVVDDGFIESIRNPGFELHLWCAGSAADALQFLKPGVQSLTTNHPRVLKAAVRSMYK